MILRTNAQLGEAETECKALRQLVRLKAHELRNIRRLAQEVLLQRGDVETFLLSSLSLVSVLNPILCSNPVWVSAWGRGRGWDGGCRVLDIGRCRVADSSP